MKKAVFIDFETTGFDEKKDEVIEVAFISVLFDDEYNLLKVVDKYNEFQEPNEPISEFITNLTSITNEIVKGKVIDWSIVENALEQADIIIAHNAQFDKKWALKYTNLDPKKKWACSVDLIDWKLKYGTKNAKLETLKKSYKIKSGKSHRAIGDVITLVKLLKQQGKQGTFFQELYNNFHEKHVRMICHGVKYDDKELIKQFGFRWFGKDKYWYKNIPVSQKKEAETKLRKTVNIKRLEWGEIK